MQRRPSPGGRPQPLALFGDRLWIGSWGNRRIYGVDPATWKVEHDVEAPGTPYGIAPLGNGLTVVVSDDSEADDRYFYRFVPGKGFDEASKTPCPDLTGSHLASDGRELYLGQMHNQRIVTLDAQGQIAREIPLSTRCGGFGFGPGGTLYAIAADEEFEKLELATLALDGTMTPIAPFEFGARCLAYDGKLWYTSNREAGEIVTFTL
jgi:DNA-binding beta-propeller fold protein YncE